VAAFGALWLGLGVLKRILRRRKTAAATDARNVQQAAERDALAGALEELSGAVRVLAEKPEPEPVQSPGHSALLGELLAAVKDLAGRPAAAQQGPLPDSAESAARAAYRATLLAGNPWPQRQMEIRFGMSRGEFTKMRDDVIAELWPETPQQPIRYAALPVPSVNGSGS